MSERLDYGRPGQWMERPVPSPKRNQVRARECGLSPQLAAELLSIVEDLYDGSDSPAECGRKYGRAVGILSKLAGVQSECPLQPLDYLELTAEAA